MPRTPRHHPDLPFDLPVMMRFTAQGDGTFKAAPVAVPDGSGEAWVVAREAARILGLKWSRGCTSLTRLAEAGHVRSRRITPFKVEYELGTLLAHKKAAVDPEFWAGERLKR